MLSGYYFYTADGTKTEGSVNINNATDITISGSHTYNSGYYPTQWTVSGLDTSDATAKANNIESGKTAYVNGVKITGIANVIHELLKYTETITPLSVARTQLSATSVGNYALFGGGVYYRNNSPYVTNIVESYDSILISSTVSKPISGARCLLASTRTNNNYGIFGYGRDISGTSYAGIEAYNSSLTKTSSGSNTTGRYSLAATTIGNYALFGGGQHRSTYYNLVDVYDTSLTNSTATSLSQARDSLAAATIGNYALFGGGTTYTNANNYFSVVDTYNTSLTKSIATVLSIARHSLAAASVGNYVLFGGGQASGYYNTVDTYNASLTKGTATSLSQGKQNLAATTIGEYALFGGGQGDNGAYYNAVDAYNSSLSRFIPAALSQVRQFLAATIVGDYALFGGGATGTMQGTVDAYYIS